MKGQSYEHNHLITQMIERSEYDNKYALLIVHTISELHDQAMNTTNEKTFAETTTLKAGICKFGEK